MLTNEEIAGAIARILQRRFPDCAIFEERLPTGYSRAAFVLKFSRFAPKRHDRLLVRAQVMATIVCVGPQGSGAAKCLAEMKQGAIALFDKRNLFVADRALNVSSADGGSGSGQGWVDVTCTYYELEPMAEKAAALSQMEK